MSAAALPPPGPASGNLGIGWAGMFTALFVGLKLCRVIAWSWLWVLSPLWGSLALVVVLVWFLHILDSW